MDWKEALSQLGGLPEGESAETVSASGPDEEKPCQKGALHVLIEKKGRGGKTATIVEGFEIDDEQVSSIASEMRRKLGTGGSARGGEILIQGDRKADVMAFLKGKGFKVKA
ncbi:MAG: translation initiation factor [Muribaculaceae bacterium]|nr:translation initiation factor [Muribaculaceae bacterium]